MDSVISNKSVFTLTNKYMKKIYANIQYKLSDIFNVVYLKEMLLTENDIENIDISILLNMKIDTFYECKFIDNNFCWISRNANGKMRYFTKRYILYGLDIYDLLCIFFNCRLTEISSILIEKGFGEKIKNNFGIQKYSENIKIIEELLINNNYLKNMLKEKIDIYIALNNYGKKVNTESIIFNNKELFFVSLRHLKKEYSLNYSISTISKTINLYNLFGLVKKIESDRIRDELDIKSNVCLYFIPSIKISIKELKSNDLYTKKELIKDCNLNRTGINKILKDEYNLEQDLYFYENKKKNTHIVEIERLFYFYLKEYNIVAKEWILGSEKVSTSISTFNKKWKQLSEDNLFVGKSIKPNKNLKKKYSLKTNQDVFVLTRNS
ncbi:TPA: hypothetical protein KQE75_003898 [Clostridioides difficile]|nr:hypothetical protein BN174_4320014 [Clostridioides difficile E15]HBG4630619.1 hypothetical protein [Clostridioides difficile]